MVGGHWAKNRIKIMTNYQHPLAHSSGDFPFSSPALPGVVSIEGAINYMLAVLYPQTKATVANVAALPLVGNSINDFRAVSDDGDGNSAGYRWEQREGEGAPSWHKIYDFDWGSDSILQQFLTKTQDLYVKASGNDDLDASGVPIAGTYAGQTIYGGTSANTNLTLRANSGDGVGAGTGFVQVDDNFRPAVDSAKTLGTITERWLAAYVDSITSGTFTATSGSLTDSSGAISFDNENLSTTGTLGAGATTVTSLDVSSGGQTMALDPGSITDTTGAISFGDENLSTTGTMGATSGTFGNITVAAASITSSTGAVSFDNENLSTTGTLGAGEATFTKVNSDNLTLDGNTISSTNLDGNIVVAANGFGVFDVNSPMETLGQTIVGDVGLTGTETITGRLNVDNLRLDGNTLSSEDVNGAIILAPNGTGSVITKSVEPNGDNTYSLGTGTNQWNTLYLQSAINDGANNFLISDLMKFRDANTGALAGMSLFYDGSKWVASAPDTEITHNTISGLTTGDAGHTQFALLAGRAGGQSLIGGTAASEDLVLESTANATKGFIKIKDDLVPNTTASFAGTWSGTDLGDASFLLRNVYSRGEFFGIRPENVVGAPGFDASTAGRLYYDSTSKHLLVNTGADVRQIGQNKYSVDVVWAGETTKSIDLTGTVISDARQALIQMRDTSGNNFEIMYVQITTSSATDVTITTGTALTGTYRVLIVE